MARGFSISVITRRTRPILRSSSAAWRCTALSSASRWLGAAARDPDLNLVEISVYNT